MDSWTHWYADRKSARGGFMMWVCVCVVVGVCACVRLKVCLCVWVWVRERESAWNIALYNWVYRHLTELCQTKPFFSEFLFNCQKNPKWRGKSKNLHLQYCQIISLFFFTRMSLQLWARGSTRFFSPGQSWKLLRRHNCRRRNSTLDKRRWLPWRQYYRLLGVVIVLIVAAAAAVVDAAAAAVLVPVVEVRFEIGSEISVGHNWVWWRRFEVTKWREPERTSSRVEVTRFQESFWNL